MRAWISSSTWELDRNAHSCRATPHSQPKPSHAGIFKTSQFRQISQKNELAELQILLDL